MSQRNEHSVAAQRVAVVVATHEYTYPMEKCLSGFAAQVATEDVILVDNGSGGKVAEWATPCPICYKRLYVNVTGSSAAGTMRD